MYNNENNNGNYNDSENNNNNYYNNSGEENNNSYYNNSGEDNNNSYYNNSGDNNNSYYNSSQNNTSGNYDNSGNDYNQDWNKNNKRKNKTPMVVVAVIVAAVILVAALGVTIATTFNNINSSDIDKITSNKSNSEQTEDSGNYEDIGSTKVESGSTDSSSSSGVFVTDASSVVDSAMPSVVAITSKTLVEASNDYTNDIFEYYFGGRKGDSNNSYEEEAAGSGIIVDQTDSELLIVTNNHVVEGADSLKIQFNGEESEDSVDGYIKGTDSNADIAVVAVKLKDISDSTLKNIKKATLGDSDSVKVGEGVIAIGNALGYGQSVTTGVISAKDREATIENKTMKLLQTDAAINGGNSGGALLNAQGEVIGINVAKYSSSGDYTSASVEGMGFAIPISSVKSIISTLETKETREKVSDDEKGYLGLSGYPVTEEESQQYGLPIGLCIQTVVEDSPADKAGIKQYDVITKFDGQTVTTMASLQNILEYYKAGEKVKVTVAYNSGQQYKEKDVTVTLGDKSVVQNNQ
ncbi:MAG: S1C family serine protease [Eubacterium sp.]